MEWSYPISIGERELLLDLVIESKETVTIVEIKSRINEDTIYRIYAFSEVILDAVDLMRSKELFSSDAFKLRGKY